ncbi:MAG: hypothetical protein ACYSU4_22300 [Planctomycetota bacterium]|jgi:hypothetical protein
MKQCTKCKKRKDESEFGKDRSRKDGLSLWCKDCIQAMGKYNNYKDLHRVAGGVKQKRCGRCQMWKAENQYYKHSRHNDGLAVWCKECANKATNKARKKRIAIRN